MNNFEFSFFVGEERKTLSLTERQVALFTCGFLDSYDLILRKREPVFIDLGWNIVVSIEIKEEWVNNPSEPEAKKTWVSITHAKNNIAIMLSMEEFNTFLSQISSYIKREWASKLL